MDSWMLVREDRADSAVGDGGELVCRGNVWEQDAKRPSTRSERRFGTPPGVAVGVFSAAFGAPQSRR
jgi:hypothetical protein